ncbi:LrgB family protein [Paraburkholderia strydomiana]|uniref:LrgB family protein n=1 Tax=Paraburkholderia strydomiana TaxID=1245417 RepID=UPI0038B96182
MTGITGAILGVPVLNVLRVTDPRIAGLLLGVAGHGIGTARALQICEEAGAVAGLGMCLSGILTAFVLPPFFPFLCGDGCSMSADPTLKTDACGVDATGIAPKNLTTALALPTRNAPELLRT